MELVCFCCTRDVCKSGTWEPLWGGEKPLYAAEQMFPKHGVLWIFRDQACGYGKNLAAP